MTNTNETVADARTYYERMCASADANQNDANMQLAAGNAARRLVEALDAAAPARAPDGAA